MTNLAPGRPGLPNPNKPGFATVARSLLGNHVEGRTKKLSNTDVEALVAGFKQMRKQAGDYVTAEIFAGIAARAIASKIDQYQRAGQGRD